jgi:large subunit ribosomal protein L1
MAKAKTTTKDDAEEIQPEPTNDTKPEEVTAEIEAPAEKTDDDEEEQPVAETRLTKAGRRSAKAVREEEAETARKAAAATAKSEDKPAPKPKPQQQPNPLKRHGKNYRAAQALIDQTKQYTLSEAVELAKQTAKVKFDASVEIHINLGVDPRQADQMVRSSVVLPAGTGKSLRVAVLAAAEQQAAAKTAGADIAGEADLLAKIEKGQLDFDRLITAPDQMPKLAKLAKTLGPKGLMPNPKSGTVTTDVAEAVRQAKAGKVEFRIDKQAIIHQVVGKASFKAEDLLTNTKTLIDAVLKAKPSAAKGTYVKAMSLTTAMGPSIKLNVQQAIAESNPKK